MPNETYALFDTTEGKFKAKLYTEQSPKTVENFVSLADGTKTGKPFYDGIVFHRVIPDFMIQGGCPKAAAAAGRATRSPMSSIPRSAWEKRFALHGERRSEYGREPILVTVAATPWLDNKHAIFGEVVEGYDIVEKISKAPRDGSDRPGKR